MENKIDTWLEQKDLQRIWNIVQGDGNQDNTTKRELEEFQRVLFLTVQLRSLN